MENKEIVGYLCPHCGNVIPLGDDLYCPHCGKFLVKLSPCDTCNNNPKNGGSGICACTLNLDSFL